MASKSRFFNYFLTLLLVAVNLTSALTAQVSREPLFRMPAGVTADDYIPGKVVFKIREEVKSFDKSGVAVENEFLNILRDFRPEGFKQKFPLHQTPVNKNHLSGQPLVDLSLIYEINLPIQQNLEDAIIRLYESGLVEYAQPYYLPQTLDIPNDPFITSQYYLEKVQALEAWAVSKGDTSIVIAITDTGIDLNHPDLINNIAYNYDDPVNGNDSDNDGYVDNFYGWDLGENNNTPQYNVNAHGVHVSGIAGASANNGTGIAGVGYNSRILPVKISDQDGRLVRAYEGIVYAADRGARVINCSWGGAIGAGQFGQDIINYAVLNKDAVVVAAAGNSNNQVRLYPASYTNALSVAATDINDLKWSNSSFGTLVDLSAPGANLLSTWINGTYISSSGTSLAAPVVAGAAAILRSHFPDYSALQIAAQLKVTTDNIDTIPGNQAYSGLLGTGRLNIYRALTETHHPYIMLTRLQHDNKYYQLHQPGETLQLAAEYQNLLAATENIKARLTTQSEFVEIISDEASLGNMVHLEITNNFLNPFVIRLKENIPPSHVVNFTISFFTDNDAFAGKQNFFITFNLDFIDFRVNEIYTTVNSRGGVGFNYPNLTQGVGFIYGNANQGRNLIKCSGLVIGNSTSKVVDNIYGAVEDSFSGSFFSEENARIKQVPDKGDFQIKGSFTDNLAGLNKIGVSVDYRIYGFEDSPFDKFIILEYDIINTSGSSLPGLHAGFFADWALQDIRNHRASFDPENNLGYAFSANGGNFTGIQLLSHQGIRHYAFDKQGFGGSIKISDGFTSFEKYTAMKTSRDNAGVFDKDNDIGTLISAGPFILLPNDTLRMAFALLAGNHINDLQTSAQLARMVYEEGPLSISDSKLTNNSIRVYPNPAGTSFHIEYYSGQTGSIVISVFDIAGRQLTEEHTEPNPEGYLIKKMDCHEWKPGIYLLQVRSGQEVRNFKLLKE